MSDYPTSVYSPRTKANRSGIVYDADDEEITFAEDVSKLDAEVVALENSLMALSVALTDDGQYNGIVKTGTAGAALAFGDLVYLDPTDSKWELADANSAAAADGDARGILGICVLAAAENAATLILVWGKVRAATFPAFTKNAQLFVSETAGDITESYPTTEDAVVRVVGVALTAEDLFFNPSPDFITYAA